MSVHVCLCMYGIFKKRREAIKRAGAELSPGKFVSNSGCLQVTGSRTYTGQQKMSMLTGIAFHSAVPALFLAVDTYMMALLAAAEEHSAGHCRTAHSSNFCCHCRQSKSTGCTCWRRPRRTWVRSNGSSSCRSPRTAACSPSTCAKSRRAPACTRWGFQGLLAEGISVRYVRDVHGLPYIKVKAL